VDFVKPDPGQPSQDLLLKEEESRKADALASFASGLLAEDSADPDESLNAFRKVLDLDPGFSDLAGKVAMELVRRKSYDQAINVLKDAIKVAPTDPAMPLLVSQIYWKYLKKAEPAIRYANQVLELEPDNEWAFLTLLEAQARQPKKAELVLDRASKLKNQSPRFWIQLAEVYSRALLQDDSGRPGNLEGKKQELEKINAVYRKALELARKPDLPENGGQLNSEILLKVADYYTASRQYQEAIPLYEELVKQLENSPEAILPEVQDKLARCYRLANRTQDAIASLKELIRQNPMRTESYELLAGIYEEEGDFENALANYQQVLLMNPAQPMNYLRVADMQLKLGKPELIAKAVETLKEARAKFPEIPQITYSLAIALTQAGKPQEALSSFADCYNDAKASQPDMLNAAFYFAYGASAEQAGNLEQAEVMLKKSIEADPGNSAQACNYLGYMWVEHGLHLEEAGKLIQQALEQSPSNGPFLDSFGWYYFKKGDYPKALEQLKKAATLIKPEDPVVYEHLGDTYFNLGNTAEALASWRKALELEEKSPVHVPGSPGVSTQTLKEKIASAVPK
jgi:tetratricopeptide (TPR) repeat protein